jgi:hypothetical protein
MYYLKLKCDKNGTCNICHRQAPLSWDHVPPKGGIQCTSVQIRSVFSVLTGETRDFKPTYSQNGLKYRTICKTCNQTIGHKYDVALNEFSLSIGKYLSTSLSLPPIIQHPTRPAALIRSVLAHILAAKVKSDGVFFDRDIPPTILDETLPIPADVHVFYWIFPFEETVLIRDFAISYIALGSKEVHSCQLLKYFPVAYLITNTPQFQNLDELTAYRNASITDTISIPIRLSPVRSSNWPEGYDDGKIMLGGQSMLDSAFVLPKR